MIMIHPMRAALVLAAMIGCAAAAARADECESMTKSVKVLIDKTFKLSEAAAAHAYIESRKAVGRVILVP